MNRREILRYAAYLSGAAVSAPFASAFLLGCKQEGTATAAAAARPPYTPKFFSPAQYKYITQFADTVLPRTDTPGASDVGVPELIDQIVGEVFLIPDRDKFMLGLQQLMDKMDADHAAKATSPATDSTAALGGFAALD
ncbi:MAG: gluconate 2-dehydrogenase subunit 3 family protein, partial [Lewinella sp.]|nr:gluconate 2-dehydrogenase subunit 3 family protein [Lewinella sp.]